MLAKRVDPVRQDGCLCGLAWKNFPLQRNAVGVDRQGELNDMLTDAASVLAARALPQVTAVSSEPGVRQVEVDDGVDAFDDE